MGFLKPNRCTNLGFLGGSLNASFSLNASLSSKKRAACKLNLNTGTRPALRQKTISINTNSINKHDQEITQSNIINAHQNASPCNIYFGENFTVRLQQWFKFLTFVENNEAGGIVHCDFTPNRKMARMNLSTDATKIRDVPNAGGSSVVSEVLSFEVLQKCFKASLLKVRL